MRNLRSIHRFHDGEEYEHSFTEEEVKKINAEAQERKVSVQTVVKEFAKTCSWNKIS